VKVSPRREYPVGVRPQAWEEDPEVADLFAGIYEVTLNHLVSISFVPDVSEVLPPGTAELPADLDDVSTVVEARLATVLLAPYTVTPNRSLAGEEQVIRRLTDDERPTGVVFYCQDDEFSRFSGELDELSKRVGDLYPELTVADLGAYEVVQFIETRVLRSSHIQPEDLFLLGRGSNGIVEA